jgi:ribosome maturation factor RimP
VALVEDISGTKGAKYCSVDSKEEFSRIMNKEFDYDVTILAFNISVEIKSPGYRFVKGYG